MSMLIFIVFMLGICALSKWENTTHMLLAGGQLTAFITFWLWLFGFFDWCDRILASFMDSFTVLCIFLQPAFEVACAGVMAVWIGSMVLAVFVMLPWRFYQCIIGKMPWSEL